MSATASRKALKSRTHKVVLGPLCVAGWVQVGGDLTIEGDADLQGPVLCLGRLTVKGSLRAWDVFAGGGIDVQGDLRVSQGLMALAGVPSFDDVAEAAQQWAAWHDHGAKRVADAAEHVADAATLQAWRDVGYGVVDALSVGGDCVVEGSVKVRGSVDVRGAFHPDDCEVSGCISAERMHVEGDLFSDSHVSTRGWLLVEGETWVGSLDCSHFEGWGAVHVEGEIDVRGWDTALETPTGQVADYRKFAISNQDVSSGERAASLLCMSSLRAADITAGGSIEVHGELACSRYIKANRNISCAGKLSAGKGFGVLAGLNIARADWPVAGYICAPSKPLRILAGAFRPLAKRQRGPGLRPAKLVKAPRR